MTHWLPYIAFWAFAGIVLAVLALYVYAAWPVIRPTPQRAR